VESGRTSAAVARTLLDGLDHRSAPLPDVGAARPVLGILVGDLADGSLGLTRLTGSLVADDIRAGTEVMPGRVRL
jgi:hypothetical protein